MLKTIIIDDEAIGRDMLRSFVSEYCPQLDLVGEATDVAEGVELIRAIRPELVLLDIQLTDGTGFDLLDQFKPPFFQVIFTTAYDEFALRAFRYHAIDYLLKPIDPDELVEAAEKAAKNKTSEQFVKQLSSLMETANLRRFEKITLPSTNGLIILNADEIIRLEAKVNYCNIHTSREEKVLITRTLKWFEETLPEKDFFRAHQSHMINMHFVRRFLRDDGGLILMQDGARIPLARRRKDDFLDRIS